MYTQEQIDEVITELKRQKQEAEDENMRVEAATYRKCIRTIKRTLNMPKRRHDPIRSMLKEKV